MKEPVMKIGKAEIYVTPWLDNPYVVASPQGFHELMEWMKEKEAEFKRMEDAWRKKYE